MPERPNGADSKSVGGVSPTGVRIPLPPPVLKTGPVEGPFFNTSEGEPGENGCRSRPSMASAAFARPCAADSGLADGSRSGPDDGERTPQLRCDARRVSER